MMLFKNHIFNATLSGNGAIDILQIIIQDPHAKYKVFEYLILIAFHQERYLPENRYPENVEKFTGIENANK